MHTKPEILTYIGAYPIDQSKPLRRELVKKIKGVGLVNVMDLLAKLNSKYSQMRSLCLKDLDENSRNKLSELVSSPYIKGTSYTGNRKNIPLTEEYKSEIFFKEGDLVFMGEYVDSNVELSKKRLVKLKCYIGNRLKLKQKVHGQRTKSTGRKTKAIKGFQKKKKLQKEVERR